MGFSTQMIFLLLGNNIVNRYEDTIIFYGIYLDSLQIVPCYPQKNHPIPAGVLPSDSEELFTFVQSYSSSWFRSDHC